MLNDVCLSAGILRSCAEHDVKDLVVIAVCDEHDPRTAFYMLKDIPLRPDIGERLFSDQSICIWNLEPHLIF